MDRRTYLRTAALTPLAFSQSGVAAETDSDGSELLDDIGHRYFSALNDTEQDSTSAVVGCANEICEKTELVKRETISSLSDGVQTSDDGIRRARLAVGILNEYSITDVVTASEILKGERKIRAFSKYVPLLGSFNNLCSTACLVSEDKPETIQQFLYASLAFGIEVGLWSVGAPFTMAWRGTRFVSNRSFLRYAKNGCGGCVAFLMSELHWAIREAVYAGVSAGNIGALVGEVDFVLQKLQDLNELAEKLDYPIDVDYNREEVIQILREGKSYSGTVAGGGAAEMEPSFFDKWIPEFEIEIPTISDFIE